MRNKLVVAIAGIASAVLISAGCASVQTRGGIPGVVAPGVEPELVQEGYMFTEGPLGTTDGGLYFTDLREANRIYRLDASGKISVVRENSNGTNGLAFTRSGDLVGAEGSGKRISKIAPDGKATELTRGDGEKPLMAPNDLIADANGGIYFTDPGPRPLVPGRKAYLYYLPAGATKAVALDDGIVRPNGLILTLDAKTLIVADTVGDTLFAFDVQPNGTVRNKRPFIRLRDIPQGEESGADGIAIDRDGRIYVTTITGVQVFDKTGEYLGTIRVARRPSNIAFSGPGNRTLYITAREGLYRVQTLTQGPDRLGK
jgi:gluconolactonase